MKKKISLVIVALCFIPKIVYANEGWVEENNETYYYENGEKLEGFQEIDGKNYFFGIGSNRLLHGWQYYEGKFYADPENGEIKPGWQHIGTEDYYIRDNHTVEGFQEIDGSNYFFGIGSNRLLHGWQNWYGLFYADEETGIIPKEWFTLNNNKYYSKDNYVVTGIIDIDGKKLYFDNNGILVEKTKKTKYKTIIINENGEFQKIQYTPIYYNQKDNRWTNIKYGAKKFGPTGCAPTSMAMAFTSIKEKTILPTDVANYLYYQTNEYNKKDAGTSGMGIVYATRHYGINIHPIKSKNELIEELLSGKIVFAAMTNGRFATPNWNHAIVVYDYDEEAEKTLALDPLNKNNNKWTDIDIVWNEQSKDPDDTSGGAALYSLS